MRGYIIYNRDDAKRNENYIGWYIEKFKKEGVGLELIYTDEIDCEMYRILQL